ncbi:hypothetical protein [Macellibacteroides fermentans]|uniref:Uncharacterized protein n=1 Tax=Macellibacteroides fermentans TaxID=879969 RepID=A0A8E2D5E7_9PORP|nr:hypothetical protein [Macellibacteroides fermentans]NYI51067.1 hypothetical protein [Macellibacteroides fermentans]
MFHNLAHVQQVPYGGDGFGDSGTCIPAHCLLGIEGDPFRKGGRGTLLKRGTLTALGLTGGICLILWLMPALFLDFRSPMDTQYHDAATGSTMPC